MIVISDTSPISALVKIGKLQLLEALFHDVVISETVKQELLRLEDWGYDMRFLENAAWIRTQRLNDTTLFENLSKSLDRGEAEAIALAKELNADLLLIDEAQGRKVAQTFNIPILGVLGVIAQAKAQHLIPEARPILERMISEAKVRISPTLIEYVLQQLGE